MLGRLKWAGKRRAGVAPGAGGRRQARRLPSPEFDEALYLKLNPDVAAKVEAEPGFSGWRYFIEQGWLENRLGVPPSVYAEVRRRKNYELDHVLPPAFLRKRIHGSEDINTFEQVGRAVAADIVGYLERAREVGSRFPGARLWRGMRQDPGPAAGACAKLRAAGGRDPVVRIGHRQPGDRLVQRVSRREG